MNLDIKNFDFVSVKVMGYSRYQYRHTPKPDVQSDKTETLPDTPKYKQAKEETTRSCVKKKS